MKLLAIALAVALLSAGAAVYFNNKSERQRQAEFYASPLPVAKEAQGDPYASGGLYPELAQTGESAVENVGAAGGRLNCQARTVASIQRCLLKNDIPPGSEEGIALVALGRRGHAQFAQLPHEKDGKCRVDLLVAGRHGDKDMERLLKDCEVE